MATHVGSHFGRFHTHGPRPLAWTSLIAAAAIALSLAVPVVVMDLWQRATLGGNKLPLSATQRLDEPSSDEQIASPVAPIALPAITVEAGTPVGSAAAASRRELESQPRLMSGAGLSASSPRDVTSGALGGERQAYWSSSSGDDLVAPDGVLDPSIIADEIARRRDAITAIYVHALRDDADLSGKIEVQFTIDGAGDVRGVKIKRDTVREARLAEDVRHIVGSWRFPAPPGGKEVQVIYPFTFRPLSE